MIYDRSMLISEAIKTLAALQAEHGDIELVDEYDNEPTFSYDDGAINDRDHQKPAIVIS